MTLDSSPDDHGPQSTAASPAVTDPHHRVEDGRRLALQALDRMLALVPREDADQCAGDRARAAGTAHRIAAGVLVQSRHLLA